MAKSGKALKFIKKYIGYLIFAVIGLFFLIIKLSAGERESDELPDLITQESSEVQLDDRETAILKINQKKKDAENNFNYENEPKTLTFESTEDNETTLDPEQEDRPKRNNTYSYNRNQNNSSNTGQRQSYGSYTNTSKQHEEDPGNEETFTGSGIDIADNNSSDGIGGVVFISAYFEEDVVLKDGTTTTFRLAENATIDGMQVKKNSLVYGVANITSDRVLITANRIRTTRGKDLQVALEVYDSGYTKGLYYSKETKKAVDESGDDVVDGILDESPLGGGILKGAKDAAQGLKNKASLSVQEGFKIYFKERLKR